MQHKRIVRVILDAGFRDHTEQLFKKIGLLKLCDVYKLNALIYMYKNMPTGNFTPNHVIDTRSRNEAQPHFHRLTLCQDSITYLGTKLWNQLPTKIKSIDRTWKLKKNV